MSALTSSKWPLLLWHSHWCSKCPAHRLFRIDSCLSYPKSPHCSTADFTHLNLLIRSGCWSTVVRHHMWSNIGSWDWKAEFQVFASPQFRSKVKLRYAKIREYCIIIVLGWGLVCHIESISAKYPRKAGPWTYFVQKHCLVKTCHSKEMLRLRCNLNSTLLSKHYQYLFMWIPSVIYYLKE